MKKKVYATLPIFLLISTIMFIMSIVSFFFNKTVAYIEILVSIASFVFIAININKFNKYIGSIVKKSEELVLGKDKQAIDDIKIPAVVVGIESDIVYYNDSFKKILKDGKAVLGQDIKDFLNGKSISDVFKTTLLDVRYNDLRYSVFGVKGDKTNILYFIDDTYYKNIANEYEKSRPVIAIAVFDNKEEFEAYSAEGEDAQIVAKVEKSLQKWCARTKGFFKKLSSDRYMIIMEQADLKTFIYEKFKILEEIRSIRLDDRTYATVSIGIGAGAASLRECEFFARNALDMALGRGGDQVVIKQKDSYKFFGGVSKETEKISKVRTRIIASALSEHIKNSSNVLVMGHRFSDIDSVGASIGMYSAVKKGQKKECYVVINREQTLASAVVESIAKSAKGSEIFISPQKACNIIDDNTLLIIVDTHSDSFIEDIEVYKRCKRIVIIDHHRMMVNHIKNALVFYHEPYASSASEMVTELVQYLGSNALNRLEAETLLAGIMLDTKNFVLKTGVRTFEAAAYLRRRGADTVEVKRMFSNSIDTYKSKYQLVSEAEIFNSFAIACADQSMQDIRLACAQAADELLEIQGVSASFVLFPSEGGVVNISARSLGDVNVQVIMEAMGGGGHQTMAGAQIEGTTIEHARQKLIEIISAMEEKNI